MSLSPHREPSRGASPEGNEEERRLLLGAPGPRLGVPGEKRTSAPCGVRGRQVSLQRPQIPRGSGDEPVRDWREAIAVTNGLRRVSRRSWLAPRQLRCKQMPSGFLIPGTHPRATGPLGGPFQIRAAYKRDLGVPLWGFKRHLSHSGEGRGGGLRAPQLREPPLRYRWG